jgi:hypothetical protein
MEFAIIPIIGLGGLYIISNQESKKGKEAFRNKREAMPNVDIPNKNYPNEYPIQNPETDTTANLTTVNKYDGQSVYTDRYFSADGRHEVSPYVSSANNFVSLAGQTVDLDYFRHNNMTPYFGSKTHENNAPHATESTLDNYTGAGSQFITKKEQSPLFSPGENYQWATGMPSTTNFVQSRMNAGLRMANVKPFEDVKVAPGIGLGYTSEGSGGFNSGMMARELWQEKTVDDLRVANKQKASGLMMYGHEGPAGSMVKERGHLGIVEKNRVDTTFELGPERYMTTTGIEKAPQLRPITLPRDVTRPETSTGYTGGAGFSNSAEYVSGEYMPTHRQELGSMQMTPAYARGKNDAVDADYGRKANTAYMTNRAISNQDTYYGVLGGAIGSVVAPILDILRPSRRENTIGSLRPYQNAKASVEKSYIYDPTQALPTTNRQMTENSKFHLNVNANQNGGAYMTTPQQVSDTARMTTDDHEYTGAATGYQQIRPYDAEYRQRNNDIKSSTIDGRLVAGNMNIFTGSVNMASKAKDEMLLNKRPVDGGKYAEPPSIGTLGVVQGNTNLQLYHGQQLDRNNGDVLSQLKGNPFTLDVVKGL